MEAQLKAAPADVLEAHSTLADQLPGRVRSDWDGLIARRAPDVDGPDFPIPPPKRFRGLFDPAVFMAPALAPTEVYCFAVTYRRLADALGALVAYTGEGEKQENIAEIVLGRRWIKIAAHSKKTGAFLEERMATLAEIENRTQNDSRVAFYVGLGRLRRLVAKSRKDEPLQFVLDPKRRVLRMLDRTGRIMLPLWPQEMFNNYHASMAAPTFVQHLNLEPLVKGLQMAAQYVRTNLLQLHFSYARIGGGRIEAVGPQNGSYTLLRAEELEGFTALVEAANVLRTANAIMRLEPSTAALFDTSKYHLLTDSDTCIGLPKTDISVDPMWPKFEKNWSPCCRLFIPRQELQYRLGLLAANLRDQPEGGQVRLRLEDVHSLTLQGRDGEGKSRGVATLHCSGVHQERMLRRNISFEVSIRDLATALTFSDSANAQMAIALNKFGIPGALELPIGGGPGESTISASTFLSVVDSTAKRIKG